MKINMEMGTAGLKAKSVGKMVQITEIVDMVNDNRKRIIHAPRHDSPLAMPPLDDTGEEAVMHSVDVDMEDIAVAMDMEVLHLWKQGQEIREIGTIF